MAVAGLHRQGCYWSVLLCVPLVATACGRLGFEPLPIQRKELGLDGGVGSGGTDASGGSSASGGSTSSSGGATGGASPGGAGGSLTSAPDAAPSDGSVSSGDAAAGGGSCAAGDGAVVGSGGSGADAGGAARTWSFDTSEEGWAATASSGIIANQWTGSAPGASGTIRVDVAPTDPWPVEIWIEVPLGDLSGRTVRASLWTASTQVSATVFAQSSGLQLSAYWANGAEVALAANAWTTVALDVDAPGFAGPSFDRTNVTRLGVHLNGSAAATVYLDYVEY